MLSVTKGKKRKENLNFFNWPHVLIAGKRMDADKVIQGLFDKDFGLSENETSDEEGEGIFAYAGQQHLDTVELATLSSGVEVQPSSTTGVNLDVHVNVE